MELRILQRVDSKLPVPTPPMLYREKTPLLGWRPWCSVAFQALGPFEAVDRRSPVQRNSRCRTLWIKTGPSKIAPCAAL